ncbi:MAG: cysteine hydrolase [Planctomycetes bacterium]|nr:cysteine hydrolase [Planctomycetota bacterium]
MEHAVIFVDIDTQHDFIDQNGALAVPGAHEIVPALERLTRLACKQGIPILASVDTHTQNDPEFAQFPPHCVEHTPGWRKIPFTEVNEAERFVKTTFDVFSNPFFAERVKAIGPRIAVVYGVATDYCIKAAVLGLVEIVPRVLVVEDAIRPVDETAGKKALEEMRAAGAKTITIDRVASMLEEDGC